MIRKLRGHRMPGTLRSSWLLGIAIGLMATLISGPVYAQDDTTVSGVVTDEATGDPMPGVNIAVMGTTIGTSTDAEGYYELQVPSLNDTLLYSFIGYENQAIPIQGRTTINVPMSPTIISGEQLVVVGYSTRKKQDLTGAVSVVDLDAMTTQPTGQVAKQLQGMASGVTIISSGQPGEEPVVRIRGINTFGNNEPLYVVDGVPTTNIKDLNPNSIASMQVLKDAASASIYGSRASNGVIIISTKKGQGDVTVTYDAYYGVQVPPSGNVWDKASPAEMAQITWNATLNDGGDVTTLGQYYDPANPNAPRLPDYIDPTGAMEGDASTNPSNYFIDPHYTDAGAPGGFYYITRANKEGTNWFDEIFDPAPMMSHNLAVSGGGDKGNYLVSFNYLDQEGTLMYTFNKRYSLRANTSFDVNDDIRIGENLSYSVAENPQVASLTEGSAIGHALRSNTIIPVYDIMGNFAGTQAAGLGNNQNPVAIQYRNRNDEATDTRLFGNLFAEIDFLDDHLTFRTSFGGELYSGASHSFQYPTYEVAENTTTNQFNSNSYSGYNYTWTNTLMYLQEFNDVHNVQVLVGTEAYQNKGSELHGSTQSYFSFDPNYTNLDTGAGTQTNSSLRYQNTLLSLIGRLDYSYDNRYLLSATIRRDGSSRFLTYQWGWFPAASVGWRITEESFFPEISWLTDLKLRAGIGVMGNQLNVDPNNPYTLYENNQTQSYYPIDGSDSDLQLGFQQDRIGNPDAKWERDINTNIGIDATLFNGRLEVIADYYQKDIKDLLYDPELPGTAGGADPPDVNVGSMRNTGLDASLRTFGTIANDLLYDVRVSFTTYNNEIVKISEGVEFFGQEARRYNGQNIIRNAVGHPVSSFFGYNIIGFWDSEDEINAVGDDYQEGVGHDEDGNLVGLGRFRYEDVDGDGQITPDDRTFLGNPNPDFTYGLNLGLNYKAFDFNMFWYGSQGNEIWNQVKWWHDFYSGFQGAKSDILLYDSWTPENHDATVPIVESTQSFSNNLVPNSYMVEDGSYLRLKNIQLGYTLPVELLARVGISSLRVYVQATNLLTITNYSGIDPEVGFFPGDGGGSPTAFGIDEGSYPSQRTYLIGINLSY